MSHASIYDPFVLNQIPDLTAQYVLDCGCGYGVWGYQMSVNRSGNKAYTVGLDCTDELLKFNKEHKVYNDLVKSDVRFLPFKEASFDFVLASEIIEHLTKVDGARFLDSIERVCRGAVVITTPQGFWPQGTLKRPDAETHRSTWFGSDFRKRSYVVHGIGCRFLKLWMVKRSLLQIYAAFFCLCTPFSWLLPSLAEYLIAKKKV